jgi:hypothetical protein
MPPPYVDVNWSDDIETVLGAIYDSCTLYAHSHKKRYFYLKGYLKYFRIPTIIISGVNSVCSVGLQPYVAQKNVSIITCILALICGIITSMELYLQIQSSMESDLMAAKDFLLLAADIFKMLTLDRENRGVGGISYLEETFGIYCKYIEGSQLLDRRMPNMLRLKTRPYNDTGEFGPDSNTSARYTNANLSGTSRDSGKGTNTDYDFDGDSIYSTVRRKSYAVALGMTEPILSALRLTKRHANGSEASPFSHAKFIGSGRKASTGQNSVHNAAPECPSEDTKMDDDVSEEGPSFGGENRPRVDAPTSQTAMHHRQVMDSLWRVHESEQVPSEITLDTLEKGEINTT